PINLVKTFGGPLVAPSANPSGKISPTTLDHVMQDMGDKLDLIFNGGTCAAGIESTPRREGGRLIIDIPLF
ncbi:MAG: hypothetical protein F6K34_25670, partial [Okeania sp. SIO4D6]|nr:hypothetical protein [Okeania sp. SIO4D6]